MWYRVLVLLVFSAGVVGQEKHPDILVHRSPGALSGDAVVSDWGPFLGPTHDGISPETHLIQSFGSDGPPLVWTWNTGDGYASPAIKGDRLVYFHRVGDEEVIECIHASKGLRYWRVSYPTDYKDRYNFNGGPRCSPVIDGGRVYAHGAQGVLHCLDLETGKTIWKRNTSKEYKVKQDFFGVGATPLVESEQLIINVGAPGGPSVIGLDKMTGKTLWEAKSYWGPSYASPMPGDIHGKRRVFVFAGGDSDPPTGGLLSIDPANGDISCRYPFRSKRYESVNAASPVIFDDHVFITTSYRTGGDLLKLGSDGSCEKAWSTNELRCHFSTPVYRDGYLYGFDGMGSGECTIVCIDAKTGKLVWREQPKWKNSVEVNGKEKEVTYSTDRGSFLYADGQFICLGEQGHLLLLDVSPTGLKVKSRCWPVKASQSWALPVLSHGLLYVRQSLKSTIDGTPPRLLCFDLRRR